MNNILPWIDLGQWVDLVIASLTCVIAIYLTITMLHWTTRLRRSRTSLRPLIFSLALAKFALFFWTGSNVINIIILDASLPAITLPSRIMWLIVVIVQAWVTTLVRPAPILPDSLDTELDRDGRLVLIVEDNEALARIMRRNLETAGINAEFATTGTDALTILSLETPRLMIIDLGLQDMNGVELVERARAGGYTGPIIASSGAAELMDADKLAPAAFVHVFNRPPTRSEELVAAVRQWAD